MVLVFGVRARDARVAPAVICCSAGEEGEKLGLEGGVSAGAHPKSFGL